MKFNIIVKTFIYDTHSKEVVDLKFELGKVCEYGNINIVQQIKKQQLRWLGHVVRMDMKTPALKVFEKFLNSELLPDQAVAISRSYSIEFF